jgi:hypothetical protein
VIFRQKHPNYGGFRVERPGLCFSGWHFIRLWILE